MERRDIYAGPVEACDSAPLYCISTPKLLSHYLSFASSCTQTVVNKDITGAIIKPELFKT